MQFLDRLDDVECIIFLHLPKAIHYNNKMVIILFKYIYKLFRHKKVLKFLTLRLSCYFVSSQMFLLNVLVLNIFRKQQRKR